MTDFIAFVQTAPAQEALAAIASKEPAVQLELLSVFLDRKDYDVAAVATFLKQPPTRTDHLQEQHSLSPGVYSELLKSFYQRHDFKVYHLRLFLTTLADVHVRETLGVLPDSEKTLGLFPDFFERFQELSSVQQMDLVVLSYETARAALQESSDSDGVDLLSWTEQMLEKATFAEGSEAYHLHQFILDSIVAQDWWTQEENDVTVLTVLKLLSRLA